MENNTNTPDAGNKNGLAGGDLHRRIMSLPCRVTDGWNTEYNSTLEALKKTYAEGFCDARQSAAELAAATDMRMRTLLNVCHQAAAALHRASEIHEIHAVENDLWAAIADATSSEPANNPILPRTGR